MTARPRCARGHFLPAHQAADYDEWDTTCHCATSPRRRRRPRFRDPDTWGQGLWLRNKNRISIVRLKGSYL